MRKYSRKVLSFLTALTLFSACLSPNNTYNPTAAETELAAAEHTAETVTEKQSESAAEKQSEPATEKQSEPATEKLSESATEKLSEPATEKITESVSETVSESSSESVSESNSERSTERFTEAQTSEANSETSSESETDNTFYPETLPLFASAETDTAMITASWEEDTFFVPVTLVVTALDAAELDDTISDYLAEQGEKALQSYAYHIAFVDTQTQEDVSIADGKTVKIQVTFKTPIPQTSDAAMPSSWKLVPVSGTAAEVSAEIDTSAEDRSDDAALETNKNHGASGYSYTISSQDLLPYAAAETTYDLATGAGLNTYINKEIPDKTELINKYAYKYSNTSEGKAAYEDYITFKNSAIEKAEKAYAAYTKLSADEQKSVTTYEKLFKIWVLAHFDTFNNIKSISFTPATKDQIEKGYIYKFNNACYYSGSMHLLYKHEDDTSYASLFLLVDTSDATTCQNWSPISGTYQPGSSNYELAFCCDNDTTANANHAYKKINLEDSTYYTPEAAAHIRAIAEASYPFVAEETMVNALIANSVITDTSTLDTGQLLTATQAAIWHYANQKDCIYVNTLSNNTRGTYYNEIFPDIDYYQKDLVTHNPSYPSGNTSSQVDANIMAIYRYLINLAPADAGSSVVISDVTYDAYKVSKDDQNHSLYDVYIKVTLNTDVKTDDHINVTASAGSDNTQTAAVTSGSKECILTLHNVSANAQINITASGSQYLEKNVYFYEPWPYSSSANDNLQRSASQSMVGVSSGSTPVYAATSFSVNEVETKGTINIVKTFRNAAGKIIYTNPAGTYSFGIYDASKPAADNKPIQTIQISYDENGKETLHQKFTNLEFDKAYYIRELDDSGTPIDNGASAKVAGKEFLVTYANAGSSGITLTSKNFSATVTVCNQINYPELPFTGGSGTNIYTITGTLLLLTAVCLLGITFQKRRSAQ